MTDLFEEPDDATPLTPLSAMDHDLTLLLAFARS